MRSSWSWEQENGVLFGRKRWNQEGLSQLIELENQENKNFHPDFKLVHFIVTKYLIALNSYLLYLSFTEDVSFLTKARERPFSNLETRAFESYVRLYVRSGCSGWWQTHARFLAVLASWAPYHILLSMALFSWGRASAKPLFFIFFPSRSCPTFVLCQHHTPSYWRGQTNFDALLRSDMIGSSLQIRIRAVLLFSWTSKPSVNFFYGSHINLQRNMLHSHLLIQQEKVPMTGGALVVWHQREIQLSLPYPSLNLVQLVVAQNWQDAANCDASRQSMIQNELLYFLSSPTMSCASLSPHRTKPSPLSPASLSPLHMLISTSPAAIFQFPLPPLLVSAVKISASTSKILSFQCGELTSATSAPLSLAHVANSRHH